MNINLKNKRSVLGQIGENLKTAKKGGAFLKFFFSSTTKSNSM